LLWLRRMPEPVGQQARWLELMEEYSFFVEHRPGKSHSNADAMSRIPTRITVDVQSDAVRSEEAIVEVDPDIATSDFDNGVGETVVRQVVAVDRSGAESDVVGVDSGVTDDEQVAAVPRVVEIVGESVANTRRNISDSLIARIRAAQKLDADIGVVLKQLTDNAAKPSWEVIAQVQNLQSSQNAEQTSGVILRLETMIHQKFGFLGFSDLNLNEKIHALGVYLGAKAGDFLVNEGFTLVVYGVAIPFIVFFLLKDGRELKKQFISIVPNRYFEFALDLVYKMDVQLGNYLRSQFTDAVAFGVLSTLVLWFLGVKYFIFIGPFAGLANLIPYVGPVAGALPAVAVSLFETGDVTQAVQVIVAFIALKLMDDILIQPLLVAKGVNLHPLLVLIAIIVGGELFGILGMLLAVPTTGFVKVVLQESIVTLKKYRFTD
jgi:predicted PurR-regulated permease PerM